MVFRTRGTIDNIYGPGYHNEPTLTVETIPSGLEIDYQSNMGGIFPYPDPNNGVWSAAYKIEIDDPDIAEQVEGYIFTLSATGYESITFNSDDGALEIEEVTMTPSNSVSVLSNGTNSYAIKDAQARSDIASLQTSKVPNTRTVNGKALSSDITLTASDVGALSSISSSDVTTALGYTPLQSSDISNMVTTDTGQNITGKKVLGGKDKTMLANTNITKGTNPASTQYINFGLFGDVTSSYTDRLGCMETSVDTSGNVTTYLRTYKNIASSSTEAHITVNYPASGSPYATAPTPTEDTNNSVQIDTVGARNTKLADYALDSDVVKLTGDQTVAGIKTFASEIHTTSVMVYKKTGVTKGTNPASTQYWRFFFADKNGSGDANSLGKVQTSLNSNGLATTSLVVYKNATGTSSANISINYPTSGSAYTSCPTPTEDTTSSVQIDTVGARNTKLQSYATTTYADGLVGNARYATSTSAADATEKAVSIPAITTLSAGQCIIVQPTITSTVANSTIKLNSFTAYPMRYNNAAITTSTDSIVWNQNYPTVWMFDGTYWVFITHGIDSNTTYSAMSVAEGTTGTATSSRTMRADYLKQIIEGRLTTGITGYDATKTQTLKNVNGTLRWVTD